MVADFVARFLAEALAETAFVAAAVLPAGTAFVVPFVAAAVLPAGTAFFVDVAFFTAMLGPFMVALRRPHECGQVA